MILHWHWPQITMAALMLIEFGMMLVKWGERRSGNYDFSTVILAPAIMIWILWCGGFWA